MHLAKFELRSVVGSPVSFSRPHFTEMLDKESHDAYDARTWAEKAYYDEKTQEVYIPGIALKNALVATAKHLGEKVKGRGQKTWAASFQTGVQPLGNLFLGVKKGDLRCESFYCHADGKRTCGTRVMRRFPMLDQWSTRVEFMIIDAMLTQEVFLRHLEQAGLLNGLGRFRPQNGGTNGRFMVGKFEWVPYVNLRSA